MNAFLWILFGWLLAKDRGRDLSTRADTPRGYQMGPPRARHEPRVPSGYGMREGYPTGRVEPGSQPGYGVRTTPPWPQVVPAGLPPWPSGWEPDEPVGAGVAARAAALLPELWRYGAGTRKTEQTEGRWITYVATVHGGGKKGVTAWRVKPSAAPKPKPTGRVEPGSTPGYGTRATPEPTGRVEPGSQPGYGTRAAPEAELGSRTLRLTSPRTEGYDVRQLQGLLHINADGVFGSGTWGAVKAFQAGHKDPNSGKPLAVDGVVGPATLRALRAA